MNDTAGQQFDLVADVIRSRRTSLLVDPERPVADDVVASLCELATWAPCHKRTWPWVFAPFTGESRARLGEAAAQALADAGEPDARVAKTRTKYLRAPVVVVVGSSEGDHDVRTAENRDATAAAIQNLLLGATAAGLASYWSSCPTGAEAAVSQVAGFEQPVAIVGIVYLGWPTRSCEPPERAPTTIVWHT